jgi:hypothetical protein
VLNDGVPVLRELRLRVPDEELGYWTPTAKDMRIPISKLLDAAVRAAAEGVKIAEDEEVKEPLAGTALVGKPRRARYRLTDRLLDEVDEVVRDAKERGVLTGRAVYESFDLESELTARNWIAAAREREKKGQGT